MYLTYWELQFFLLSLIKLASDSNFAFSSPKLMHMKNKQNTLYKCFRLNLRNEYCSKRHLSTIFRKISHLKVDKRLIVIKTMFIFKFNSTYLKKSFGMQLKRVINILLQARLTRYLLIWFTFVFPTYRFLLSFLVFFRVFPNLKGIQLSFRTNLGFTYLKFMLQ